MSHEKITGFWRDEEGVSSVSGSSESMVRLQIMARRWEAYERALREIALDPHVDPREAAKTALMREGRFP